ncbi:MAG: hypothetical protein ACREL4_10920, partial [Gemmatimonadales bacterium]
MRDLEQPAWPRRDNAVVALNAIDPLQLPANARQGLIALLDREASGPWGKNPGDSGEGYGEYVLHLVDAVLPLRDPASLRGLAIIAIHTHEAAMEFVAAQGANALPYLEEGWTEDTLQRSDVI